MTPLTSAIAMTGKYRQNSVNSVKNNPKLPISIKMSIQVGWKYAQLEGTKSRQREVIVITNRSNHIPMFTKTQMITMNQGVVRHHLIQNTCGIKTLQLTMIQ